MFSNRVFQLTFLISLLIHGAIFIQNSNLPIFPRNKPEQKLEVSYLKNLQPIKEDKESPAKKNLLLAKLPSKVSVQKAPLFPQIDKDSLFKDVQKKLLADPNFARPVVTKPDVIAVKKKITLPAVTPLDIDKIDNPSYISYYQIVREKIKRAAYQNYSRTDVGEVYLSFIIARDGYLRDIRLAEDKSCVNVYLREIALRSLKDASPFPNFPKELDYPYLSFNVVISFEIE